MTLHAREQTHAERARKQREAKRLRRHRAQIHRAIEQASEQSTALGVPPYRATDKKIRDGEWQIVDATDELAAIGSSRDKARALARDMNDTKTPTIDSDLVMLELGWKRVGANGEGHAPELKFRPEQAS